MSTLGAFCRSPLGAFIESPCHARGCATSALICEGIECYETLADSYTVTLSGWSPTGMNGDYQLDKWSAGLASPFGNPTDPCPWRATHSFNDGFDNRTMSVKLATKVSGAQYFFEITVTINMGGGLGGTCTVVFRTDVDDCQSPVGLSFEYYSGDMVFCGSVGAVSVSA